MAHLKSSKILYGVSEPLMFLDSTGHFYTNYTHFISQRRGKLMRKDICSAPGREKPMSPSTQ